MYDGQRLCRIWCISVAILKVARYFTDSSWSVGLICDMRQWRRRGVSTDLVDLTDEMGRKITSPVCKLRCSQRLGDSVMILFHSCRASPEQFAIVVVQYSVSFRLKTPLRSELDLTRGQRFCGGLIERPLQVLPRQIW